MSSVYIPTVGEVIALATVGQLCSEIEKVVGVAVASCCIVTPVNAGDACFWYGAENRGWLNHTRIVGDVPEYIGNDKIFMLERAIKHCGHKMAPETLAVFEKAVGVLSLRML